MGYQSTREARAAAGRKGGKSRSEAKLAALAKNREKAHKAKPCNAQIMVNYAGTIMLLVKKVVYEGEWSHKVEGGYLLATDGTRVWEGMAGEFPRAGFYELYYVPKTRRGLHRPACPPSKDGAPFYLWKFMEVKPPAPMDRPGENYENWKASFDRADAAGKARGWGFVDERKLWLERGEDLAEETVRAAEKDLGMEWASVFRSFYLAGAGKYWFPPARGAEWLAELRTGEGFEV